MPRRKKTKRFKAVEALDREWSIYVRYSAADSSGNARCWTCGKADHPRRLFCGHFISRRHWATRWDEDNCRPQCAACNRFNQGRQWEFGRNLDRQQPGTAESVFERSRKPFKIDPDELHVRAGLLAQRNAGLVARVEAANGHGNAGPNPKAAKGAP